MKLAIKILSYALGGIMLLGTSALAADYELDVWTLILFIIIEVQVILTLIYIEKR
jgi:F0F1-type ATP synthase membrane subunit c/vacuolar-type H+-ATPase subunit K